jgi:2-succinyl-6-hydroxy-2,4-cyclohexadiene-1-carboxylate synthase
LNILALHGFLGQGSDWNSLQDLLSPSHYFEKPSLFSPKSEFNLNSFVSAIDELKSLVVKEPKILMGYSMGGRLALELFKTEPQAWQRLILISSHPGHESEESEESPWVERFQSWDWDKLIKAWNEQPVLENSEPIQIKENEYDRQKLCKALSGLSSNQQKLDPEFWEKWGDKIFVFVGEEDQKYLNLYESLKERGLVKNLRVLEGLGHRILHDGADVLATQLESHLDL